MKYNTLFIDLDDTIWDTLSNGKESLEEVYNNHRLGRFFPTFNEFYTIYFRNNTYLWDLYAHGRISKDELILKRFLNPLKPFGITDKDYLLSLSDEFLEYTTRKKGLLPHATEVLEYLRPRYRMFILSNGFKEIQYKKINGSGLTDYFEGIILSDDAGYTKPHLNLFRYALEAASCDAETSLMIGDNWDTDIVGAANAGIDQVWFNPSRKECKENSPTYNIKSLLELKELL